MEKNKTNKILIIIAITMAALLLVATILGLIASSLYISNKNKTLRDISVPEIKNNETTDERITESNKENKAPKCTGTYYGETSGTLPNGLAYDYKYTYVLNEDGTFTANYGETSDKGTYVINDNTITLISAKHTTGPREEDPSYESVDYVIADDCSYIRVGDSTLKFNLMKR